jgi:hypothetical protein
MEVSEQSVLRIERRYLRNALVQYRDELFNHRAAGEGLARLVTRDGAQDRSCVG